MQAKAQLWSRHGRQTEVQKGMSYISRLKQGDSYTVNEFPGVSVRKLNEKTKVSALKTPIQYSTEWALMLIGFYRILQVQADVWEHTHQIHSIVFVLGENLP